MNGNELYALIGFYGMHEEMYEDSFTSILGYCETEEEAIEKAKQLNEQVEKWKNEPDYDFITDIHRVFVEQIFKLDDVTDFNFG